MATISLLHERSRRHSDTLNEQLQAALNSRVIIEQAKGKLAERLGIDTTQAFSILRSTPATATSAWPTWPRLAMTRGTGVGEAAPDQMGTAGRTVPARPR